MSAFRFIKNLAVAHSIEPVAFLSTLHYTCASKTGMCLTKESGVVYFGNIRHG